METNRIIQGDCIQVLKTLPDKSVDLIFADPPYNLQLKKGLRRPDNSKVYAVNDEWDKFSSFEEYDKFTNDWLSQCRRILKCDGTIWIIGSYHNIFRVGKTIQDLGFWILNDIIWRKSNPMPNFKGTRFTNAHETLIWAKKNHNSKYTFNYDAMKSLNGDTQMRSDWIIPICGGKERLRSNGAKIHSTQKPEALVTRIILSSTKKNDIVLDPFLGSGTTAAVSKKHSRNWIGIEKSIFYVKEANQRIIKTEVLTDTTLETMKSKKIEPRIPFGQLLERGLVQPGEIVFDGRRRWFAKVRVDGSLISNDCKGSIHQVGASVQGVSACNGWAFWHLERRGQIISIDFYRNKIRKEINDRKFNFS